MENKENQIEVKPDAIFNLALLGAELVTIQNVLLKVPYEYSGTIMKKIDNLIVPAGEPPKQE